MITFTLYSATDRRDSKKAYWLVRANDNGTRRVAYISRNNTLSDAHLVLQIKGMATRNKLIYSEPHAFDTMTADKKELASWQLSSES